MGLRNWVTKKISNVVQETVVQPVKQDIATVKDSANTKIGLATNIIRFLMYAAIGMVILKDSTDSENQKRPSGIPTEPTHIIINNYINEGGQRHDYRKPYQPKKG